MKRMFIYEPAASDIENSDLFADQDRLSKIIGTLTHAGASITRYSLDEDREKFEENKIVNRFFSEKGSEVLPIAVVNKEVIVTRRYPTDSEFYEVFFPDSDLDDLHDYTDDEGGCGCGEGGMCSC